MAADFGVRLDNHNLGAYGGKMGDRLRRLLPFVLIFTAAFYLLPLLIQDTGSAMLMMLVIFPALAFALGVAEGALCGFDIILPIGVGWIFIGTVFIHYNESALFYALPYSVICLIGSFVGSISYRSRRR